jgi:transcriptional regulator with XRE-family HTH domain
MDALRDLGDRIRSVMPEGMTQRELAERSGMTPDALSRALNGLRGLSSIEVADIATTLGADTHWLITGIPNPFEVRVAARHGWDVTLRERVNPGRLDDEPILDRVVEMYRAAFPSGTAASTLPVSPEEVRSRLGEHFARGFAPAVERAFGVDVLRLPGISTDYSLRIGNRGVIILATTPHWYRSNWSLAHELGHLALGHEIDSASSTVTDSLERAASSFASALLLPDKVLAVLREARGESAVARLVWDLGVSTEAIRRRVKDARTSPSPHVERALSVSTPKLVREHMSALGVDSTFDAVIAREQESATRRFPTSLLSALHTRTAVGAAPPEHLAWALDVPTDDIDFPEPDEVTEADAFEQMLSHRPTARDWQWSIAGVS